MLHRLRWQNELDGIGEQYERWRGAMALFSRQGRSPKQGTSKE
ncbi:hypothetical protein [Scytonema sp. PCC 10023]